MSMEATETTQEELVRKVILMRIAQRETFELKKEYSKAKTPADEEKAWKKWHEKKRFAFSLETEVDLLIRKYEREANFNTITA